MQASELMLVAALAAGAAQTSQLPADAERYFQETRRHEELWEARDRAELVRPPKPGFKPVPGKKLTLKLIARDRRMRAGDEFWYRLELTNIGSRSAFISGEPGAFFKAGYLGLFGDVRFLVKDPGGRIVPMKPPRLTSDASSFEVRFPQGLSADKKAALMARLQDPRRHELSLTLKPGETLVSRAGPPPNNERLEELIATGQDPDTPPPGDYRPLRTRYTFDKPGRYTIRAVITDLPPKGAKSPEARRIYEETALGVVESTTVAVEVSE